MFSRMSEPLSLYLVLVSSVSPSQAYPCRCVITRSRISCKRGLQQYEYWECAMWSLIFSGSLFAASTAVDWQQISHSGVSFSVPARCHKSVRFTHVAANPLYTPERLAEQKASYANMASVRTALGEIPPPSVWVSDKPSKENMPAHLFIDLSACFPELTVRILPIEPYTRIFGQGAPSPHIRKAFRDLGQVISGENTEAKWTYVPFVDASADTVLRVRFLDNNTQRGVRVITELKPDPIHLEHTDYIFQAISDDRKNYVLMEVPVRHPDLESDRQQANFVAEPDSLASREAVQQFLKTYNAQAEKWFSASESQFDPKLSSLDRIAESIRIE